MDSEILQNHYDDINPDFNNELREDLSSDEQ